MAARPLATKLAIVRRNEPGVTSHSAQGRENFVNPLMLAADFAKIKRGFQRRMLGQYGHGTGVQLLLPV
jgi:hypothetical protein